MSLSSHLRDKRSPVRGWMEERFPHTRIVARDANHELRGSAQECLVPRLKGADPSLVGTGVDYLLRACLRVTALDQTVASSAALLLAREPDIGLRAIGVEREAVQRIKKLKPSQRKQLSDVEWAELCTLCLVLARFEQYFRTGGMNPAVLELLVFPLVKCQGGLDELIPQTLTEPSVRDLEQLGRLAWEDHHSLRGARPLHLNPKFALSIALGGADADLITRGMLIDWKATTTPGIVGREQLWQLLGYALADTADDYGVHSVGIAALRWRSIINWPLAELLADLADSKPAKLKALRSDFAKVVMAAHKIEIARREALLAEWETRKPGLVSPSRKAAL